MPGHRPGGSDDVVAGLSRRQVLAIGGGVAAVGGYLLLGNGGGGGAGDPKAVVREYITAVNNDEIQQANSLLHPDAAELSGMASIGQLEIESMTVESRTDERATIVVDVTASALGQSGSGQFRFVLRKTDGEWLIYRDGGIGLQD
ncbi:MAG: hypothetical protein ABEJ40_00090 [Haloarculaceae archaeon]